MAGSYTEKFTEVHEPLTQLWPVSAGIATTTSAFVSLATYHRAVLVIDVGVMAQGATLDIHIHQAQNVAGLNQKNLVPTKAIAQLTQAGADSNSRVAVEIRTEELDVNGGFDCIGVVQQVAGGAIIMGWTLWGLVSRYNAVPVTGWNEIVP
jgi:hypothetical protein